MKNTTLVIMAAGIGSRFGGGIKQLEPVGPNGEIIMDYSIKDAVAAGFNKVVFIIRKDLEEDFRRIIGDRIARTVAIDYVFQELDDLPAGFEKPKDRTKPWGTGQAILACKDIVKEPFAVINADDYYGKEAYVKIHDFLVQVQQNQTALHFCMAGFILKNTLSENGGVTRGLCQINEDHCLTAIKETRGIVKTARGAAILSSDGQLSEISPDLHVSMNMWGFTPELFQILESGFCQFLQELSEDALTAEYLLPSIIDRLVTSGRANVKLLETTDKWFGVTYKEDKPAVTDAIRELISKGMYH